MLITYRQAAVAVFALLSHGLAATQQSEESKKAMLLLEAVAMPKKAKVCAAHIEGFGGRFEPAFQKWLQINQAQLAEGEALLRAEAEKTFSSFEQNVQAIANLPAQLLAKASPEVVEQNCEAMLSKLAAPSTATANPSHETLGGAR